MKSTIILTFLFFSFIRISYSMGTKERADFRNCFLSYAVVFGDVFDDISNLPLEGVIVEIKTFEKKTIEEKVLLSGNTTADRTGQFSLFVSHRRFLRILGMIMIDNSIRAGQFEDNIEISFERIGYEPKVLNVKVKFKEFASPERKDNVRTLEDFRSWEEKHIFQEKLSEIPHTRIPPVYLKRIKK